MNMDGMLENPNLKRVAVTFAVGYAKRMMEQHIDRLMDTEFGRQAIRWNTSSKYAAEAVLNAMVAWASTKERDFANTPIKLFLWELAKNAPSEISKRLLNRCQPGADCAEIDNEDETAVLESLLLMDEDDLVVLTSWLQQASQEERKKLAEQMSVLTKEQQKKLLSMSPEQVRVLFATSNKCGDPETPPRVGAVGSAIAALKGFNERLERRKRTPMR